MYRPFSTRWRPRAALICLLALSPGSLAADLPYPETLLLERGRIYEEDVGRNYRRAVLPRLSASERAALSGARLQFPLHGPGDGLFAFHSVRAWNGNRIVLPVKSLRFFSDLCTASAWLAARDYSQGSIFDYLNMIKYAEPAELGLEAMPLPLDALGIPENDLSGGDVESRRSACFSTGVVFILAHEIGHLVLGHRGYSGVSPRQAQSNEAAADNFALDVMSRLGDLPLGAVFFFSYASYYEPHRGDFASDADWRDHVGGATHPISGDRLLALADGLRSRAFRFAAGAAQALSLADELGRVADALRDTDLQRLLRHQAASIRPYMLAPRKDPVWQVRRPDSPLPRIPYSGYYQGWVGEHEGNAVETAMVLMRRGDRVHGRYSYAGITGTLKGRVEDGELVYRYWEPDSRGEGRMRGDARLTGAWRSATGLQGSFAVRRM